MLTTMRSAKRLLKRLATGQRPPSGLDSWPPDIEQDFRNKYNQARKYSMVDWQRMYSLYKATQYVCKHEIPGDVVECGVWRGGCCKLLAETLCDGGITDKDLYLYDTYTGMSAPTDEDVSFRGRDGKAVYTERKNDDYVDWCYASLDDVKNTLSMTSYPQERLQFIKGKVEDTVPATMPEAISILRLDTDWYESTYHELVHLFPRLVPGGVLIIDDYGHWQGSHKAVDQYVEETNAKLLFHRVTCSAVAIKT